MANSDHKKLHPDRKDRKNYVDGPGFFESIIGGAMGGKLPKKRKRKAKASPDKDLGSGGARQIAQQKRGRPGRVNAYLNYADPGQKKKK